MKVLVTGSVQGIGRAIDEIEDITEVEILINNAGTQNEEIAQWAYFLTVENRFCTGQSIVIDGGESINSRFVWPEE